MFIYCRNLLFYLFRFCLFIFLFCFYILTKATPPSSGSWFLKIIFGKFLGMQSYIGNANSTTQKMFQYLDVLMCFLLKFILISIVKIGRSKKKKVLYIISLKISLYLSTFIFIKCIFTFIIPNLSSISCTDSFVYFLFCDSGN